MYDRLPEDCIAFEVKDNRIAPHLRAGDFAVIDTSDRAPMHGELFVLQWNDGSQQVVEIAKHAKPENIVGWDGIADYWNAHWRMTMQTPGQGTSLSMRWGDGPYREDGIASKLIGRVVGIYQPDFRQHLRIAA